MLFGVVTSALIGICLSFGDVYGEGVEVTRYDGYKVVRVEINNQETLEKIQHLSNNKRPKFDFWTYPIYPNQSAVISVSPQSFGLLKRSLKQEGLQFEVTIHDLQDVIDKESTEANRQTRGMFDLNQYHRHSEINSWLSLLASSPKCAGACEMFSVGRSHEGRDMKGIKVGLPGSNKLSVWIDGGIHAREWISPATVLNILNYLIEDNYGGDADAKAILKRFDVYILPVVNPDGYDHSWTRNRLWRKNRQNGKGHYYGCEGVDLNRNWGHHWMEAGADSYPCSDIYAGSSAMSEPETQNVANYILRRKNNMKIFLTFHSYGLYWLTPWGYTSKRPVDYQDLIAKANKATSKIRDYRGLRYKVGTSTNVLYAAAGGSDDWAKGVAGIKYSYTVELPDDGRHGFVLPAREIRPVGVETYAGVKELFKAVLADYA
ncbi:carboxypeptidase B-like [Lineus longissimus]|uniref:carboxypeptidase B-like n=1 Tax=Lineus longissimus TaxID=88925 RepID=UPI002B4D5F85